MNGSTYNQIAARVAETQMKTPSWAKVWGVRHIRAAYAYYILDEMIASSKYGFDECKVAEELADLIYEGRA